AVPADPGRVDHRLVHRPDIGVEPHPDVLDVEDDGVDSGVVVEALELLGVRTVGVVDRDSGAFVDVGAFRIAGLSGATKAVLGAEDGADIHVAGAVHGIHDADQAVADDPGGIGDDADPAAAEYAPAIGVGDVGTGQHRRPLADGRVGMGAATTWQHGGGSGHRADAGTDQNAAARDWRILHVNYSSSVCACPGHPAMAASKARRRTTAT